MSWNRNQSMLENVAAISGDFHAHGRYEQFYDTFGPSLHGFPGIYALCIGMAKAMTEWEASQVRKGCFEPYGLNGLDWIGIVEEFVDRMISESLTDGFVLTSADLLRSVIEKARAP